MPTPKDDRLDDAIHYQALVLKLMAQNNYKAKLMSDPLEWATPNDFLASKRFAHLAILRAMRRG